MPPRESWRTLEAATDAAGAAFGAEHWTLLKRIHAGIAETRSGSEAYVRLLRVVDLSVGLRRALSHATQKADRFAAAVAGMEGLVPEIQALARLLPAVKAVAKEGSRIRTELVGATAEVLDPAFDRFEESYENNAYIKIGATGRAALLRLALEMFPEVTHSPRAWAFAAIALRIDPKCRDSDEFRERIGTWRREIKRVTAAFKA